ncbi:hypothetical protein A8990_12490 [Paenibacillus taihuensis]|uniref:Uncharacterized protein n=1 Tax=Paenibacillus taihuensis TaxID=1156355 RepID=A0A3D9RI81_9BACL|nr:hypothetical protein [Paenibacillus taihuensis]REE78812.1 hypothetical protein A8990_12490 [Paenibacillus taihuensis]
MLREGTEERSGFRRLALRNLFVFVWPLELAFVVLIKRKLKLGDRLAGTALYKKEMRHKKRRTVITVVAGVMLFISIFVPSLVYFIKHSIVILSYSSGVPWHVDSMQIMK